MGIYNKSNYIRNGLIVKKFLTYSISKSGDVHSRFGRLIKPHVSNAGYLRVNLSENGLSKNYSIHRIVATLYVENPSSHECVNHIDGDKLNNSYKNLEWCSRSQNQKHAYKIGLQKGYKKPTPLSESHKKALCGSRWKGQKRIYMAEGIEFDCPKKAADHFGLNRQTFYNRSKSEKFPSWEIIVREEK